VNSFSPVSKDKNSIGSYNNKSQPDSAESKNKSKVVTYYSKKNLSKYNLNEGVRDSHSRNIVPMYTAQSVNSNNESMNSKGILTISNFSNSEYNQTNAKPTSFFKYYEAKNASKPKRTTEGYAKMPGANETTNYSSNRPKSAKGVGMYMNTSKYRNSEGYTSTKYKNSISKGSVGSKNAIKKSGNTSQLK
jgi:hypothetical protein